MSQHAISYGEKRLLCGSAYSWDQRKAGCAKKIGLRRVAVDAIDLTLEKITRGLLRQSYSEGVGSDYKNV